MALPYIAGLPDVFKTATAVTSNEPELIDLDNLLSDEPSEVARVEHDGDPWDLVFGAVLTLSGGLDFPRPPIDAAYIVNHNLRPGSQVRFVATNIPLSLATVHGDAGQIKVIPTAIASSSGGLSGGVSNVDETGAPDGSYIGGTADADWWAVFDFDNPSDPPLPGEDLQGFLLYVKIPPSGTSAASVTVDLYEGGVLRQSLGTQWVSHEASGGQYLFFPWDASNLSDASGNGVQARVAMTGSLLAGAPRLDKLNWYSEQDVNDWDGDLEADSGWITIPHPARAGAVPTYPPEITEPLPTQSIGHRFDERVEAAMLIVFVRAASYGTSPVWDTAPQTYIEIGKIGAGPALVFSKGITPPGPSGRVVIESEGGRTIKGLSYGADAIRWREARSRFIVTREEKEVFMELVAWRKGMDTPFWIDLEPGVEQRFRKFTSFFATLKSFGEPAEVPTEYTAGEEMLYYLDVEFAEKL